MLCKKVFRRLRAEKLLSAVEVVVGNVYHIFNSLITSDSISLATNTGFIDNITNCSYISHLLNWNRIS